MGFQIKIFPILRVFWSISFGKVLCSSAKVLHASEKLIKCFFLRRLYSINIDCFVRDSSRLHLTFVAFCLLSDIHFVCQSALLTGFQPHFTSSVWNFCRWVAVADVPTRERSNGIFLDLILLRFTPAASCSFYCPSWQSTANPSSATLSCTCFWISLPSGIQWGEETDVGRQRLKWALESLFTFALLVFRTKQGNWHKRIQLMKGSDFP